MRRTFNYTGLKRILREHVGITLRRSADEPEFDASLNLGEYGFPGNASVWVEAYRRSMWMQWRWGTVARQQPPADRRLTEFDVPDGVLFRVRVVGQDEADRNKLLGEADRIHPVTEGEALQQRRSLLTCLPGDLGDVVWQLSWDDDEPKLLINRNAEPSWSKAARTPWFFTLVYPEVLRQILKRILIEDEWAPGNDQDPDWRSNWIRFASQVLKVGPCPNGDKHDCLDWIDDAVKSFARRTGSLSRWNNEVQENTQP